MPKAARPTRRRSLDLNLAWRRVLYDARDDLVPDPLQYRDFKVSQDDIIAAVQARLQAGYSPSRLLQMDVPKGKLAVRPGAVPIIEDRLVYTAIVGSFAERIDKTLEGEEVVPSYRVQGGKKRTLFKFGLNQWFKFQELMRQAYTNGYKYALLTDLTAYFDHVNHKILIGQLRSLRVPEKNLTILGDLLGHWSEGSPVGIPQGLEPSSFLGNICLDQLDKHMVRKNYHYFRYVDDIRVFANSESELQRAMVDIIRQTRNLGLHIQTGKTRIVSGDDILHLVNQRNEEFSAIDYHLDFGDVKTAEGELKAVLKEVMSQEEFNDRHFRKCLNGFKKAKSAAAVGPTLQKLDELQPWAQSTYEYLERFTRSHASIKRRLIEFLMDEERNIFEWPEFWMVRTLVSAANLPREFLDWCRSRVGDGDCHWNCRGQYALVLGTHGDLSDQMLVQDLISSRENEYERRAFVAGLRNLPEPGKRRVLDQLGRDYPAVVSTLSLVR